MDNFDVLAVSFESINKCVNRIKSSKISKYGLRPSHFDCMVHIDLSEDGLTSTEISKECKVDKAFVSRTTADLMEGGFIELNQKFNDGRKYRVKYILTEKGKNVLLETRALIDEFFADMIGVVSEEEMKCFWKVIKALNETIGAKNSIEKVKD